MEEHQRLGTSPLTEITIQNQAVWSPLAALGEERKTRWWLLETATL
jgi:hypothetical protein